MTLKLILLPTLTLEDIHKKGECRHQCQTSCDMSTSKNDHPVVKYGMLPLARSQETANPYLEFVSVYGDSFSMSQ